MALSHNHFLVRMEKSIANPRESIKGMITSHFHLKGNLLSFDSHKAFITFLLLREISLYSARLTNLDTSAGLWVPGKKAMSKSQECRLEEGAHQQHSQGLGRKQRSWKRSRSPHSCLISQLTSGRMASNALKGKGCKSAITTSFSQAGCSTGDRHLAGTGWRNYSRQGLADISILEEQHPKSTCSGGALQPHFSSIQT